MKLEKIIWYILGLPNTLYFNFRYFPFLTAIKLPVLVSHKTYLKCLKGKVILRSPAKFGLVKIGFNEVAIFDKYQSRTILELLGEVVFEGKASLGHGTKISCHGVLILGDNFLISAESSIVCHKRIVFGRDCLVSWDCLIMDTDLHPICNLKGNCFDEKKEVIIGNNVWICCRSLVLKDVNIANDNIIGASSVVVKSIEGNDQVFAGNPAKLVKKGVCKKLT